MVTLAISIIMALVIIYKTDSTLPWWVSELAMMTSASYDTDSRWGFLISIILAAGSILFFGTLYAMTGLGFIIQPFIQAS